MKASIRSSTRLATLEDWPSQIGVPIIRMSAASTRLSSFGQSSPRPSSCSTPGKMLWSTARTISPVTSCAASALRTCCSRTSVEDFSLSRLPLSVQLNASACNGVADGDFTGPDLAEDDLDADVFEEDLEAMIIPEFAVRLTAAPGNRSDPTAARYE